MTVGNPLWTRRRCIAALAATATSIAAGSTANAAPVARIEWPDLDWIGGAPVPRADLDGRPVVVVFWAMFALSSDRLWLATIALAP